MWTPEELAVDVHQPARTDVQQGASGYMPSSAKTVDSPTSLPARELLALYDELTALHACSAFVMQALAAALAQGGGLDERAATGAVFCTEWLIDRTAELEQQLKNIVSQAYSQKAG